MIGETISHYRLAFDTDRALDENIGTIENVR